MVRVSLEGVDPSIDGVFKGHRGPYLILDVPQFVTGTGEPTRLQGFVAVPLARLVTIQVFPEVLT